MIEIDGSQGEGGGQVLRTSLALALVTGKPFSIRNVRANRKKPGLMRQHLTAVLAAAKIGRADVEGAALGSKQITFTPGEVHGGEYEFDVGTAGNVVMIEIQAEHVTEVFTGFGRKGVPAERVATDVAREAERYLTSHAAAGEHLADQLLIPMALTGGGVFRTLAPSSHLTTNTQTLAHFLDVRVAIEPVAQDAWEVSLHGPT